MLGKHAHTTFVQRIPGARRHFRTLLPLFPRAIESLDVSSYELVLSSSHAVAKGVRTSPAQLHICYCHTPMRYAWDLRDQYLAPRGLASGVRGAVVHRVLDRLREWDRRTSARVTHFIANSQFVRERIARCYDRTAAVIHPPVDTDFFTPAATGKLSTRDYYFAASRWVPYKRMDLIAAAFRGLPDRRLVVAGDGPEAARVRAAAGPNVEFVGEVAREHMRDLLRGARAFVFAAEEDFGILPVEAQGLRDTGHCVRPGWCARNRARAVRGSPLPESFSTNRRLPPWRTRCAGSSTRHRRSIRSIAATNALQFATARFVGEYTALVEEAWSTSPARRAIMAGHGP